MSDDSRILIATQGVAAAGRNIPDIDRSNAVDEQIEAVISNCNMRLMCAAEGSVQYKRTENDRPGDERVDLVHVRDGSRIATMPATLLAHVVSGNDLVAYTTMLYRTSYASFAQGRRSGREDVQTDMQKALGLWTPKYASKTNTPGE